MSQSEEIVVVGAGLAGLSAALHLSRHGHQVIVVDGAEQVGGRIRTDVVDGYRLDRGFQVFNTAYPEPGRVVDVDALDLQMFFPGALVYADGVRYVLANPLRRPARSLATLNAAVGSVTDKARLGLLAASDALAPAGWLKRRPDRSTEEALHQAGLSGPLLERFLRPFLAGVLLDRDLETSARFFHLVWRSFARGQIGLPSQGMGALPTQLAGQLGPTAVRLGEAVREVDKDGVTLAGGERLAARAVVVATDPASAVKLVPALSDVPMRGVTTLYHRAPEPPIRQPVLVLDGEDRLIANTVVLTEVAPSYGPGSGALVSTSVLSMPDGASERTVRARLATLYGTATSSWEHLATYRIPAAVPVMAPPLQLRQSVRAASGVYVCGDHRDTASIQGAMVSGRRAAAAVMDDIAGGRRSP